MATIFCFTSTGNSLYTAKKIASEIGGKIASMHEPTVCDDDVIGFVFPVYFWGMPRMVERFISEIRVTNSNAYVFAVITCGGPVFGVIGVIKKLLKSRNIHLSYGTRIISVSNYTPEYKANDSTEIRLRIDSEISGIVSDIKNRKTNRALSLTLLNKMILKLYPNQNSDRFFSVSDSCTACATCQKVCPALNISVESGHPVFKHNCEHCLACLHHCPVQAIDWKTKTAGKERFRNAGVSLEELIDFNRSDK